jgi:hypothetical protein
MRTVIAVVAGIALAGVVVACGGNRKPSNFAEPPTATGGGGMPVPGGSPHDQIQALSDDIAANLQQMSLPQPQPWDAGSAADSIDPRTVGAIEAVCVPPTHPPGACADVCTVSTHICDNADQICKLADDLQPDDWSKGKCQDGKRSCEAGRQKCCDCT